MHGSSSHIPILNVPKPFTINPSGPLVAGLPSCPTSTLYLSVFISGYSKCFSLPLCVCAFSSQKADLVDTSTILVTGLSELTNSAVFIMKGWGRDFMSYLPGFFNRLFRYLKLQIKPSCHFPQGTLAPEFQNSQTLRVWILKAALYPQVKSFLPGRLWFCRGNLHQFSVNYLIWLIGHWRLEKGKPDPVLTAASTSQKTGQELEGGEDFVNWCQEHPSPAPPPHTLRWPIYH